MSRKAARRMGHMQSRGFMVVHPRWLLSGVLASNVTPPPWLEWHARRVEAWNERRNR